MGVEKMEFAKNMCIGQDIKNPKDIVKQLKNKQSISNIYCICIDEKSNSVMEIIHSHEIHKQLYNNKNYIIIGISNSKGEAKKMVCDIILESYKKDNGLKDLKSMLLQSFYKVGEGE